ncbi:Zn-dependent hydrolase [Flavobacterium johnsoniae]|uniref:ComEC/Rec2 family competence protein n=1 Tax=Flavobacterium TaxID=237 RepID=UPI0015C13E30|nr:MULTISPECIES: Zn-dependent hydrolase [Flavobacterium]NWL02859.1 Zn-dependent hydrolase [Flavobacterium collinsii]WET04014.1 Zn-dependent hydrolase [Flavobacterium sp. YJ01]WJS94501.1 Zn-dependent hydrolase [Flavobacterium johnsoniae]
MIIKLLKAYNGDCIHLTYVDSNGVSKNIIIDGGTSTTYTFKDSKGKIADGDLKKTIDAIKPQKIDLLILSHIDDDHIDGFLKWFGNDSDACKSIGEIWFNSGSTIKKYLNDEKAIVSNIEFRFTEGTNTSVPQAVNFEKYISGNGIWNQQIISAGKVFIFDDLNFHILSPNNDKLEKLLDNWQQKAPESVNTARINDYSKTITELIATDNFSEDTDPYNGSSIAFILTKDKLNYIFLGDAHPSLIINELKVFNQDKTRLKAEYLKLSHHGSKKNNPVELFKLIDTDKYLISTNGDMHGHPDKITIARIISVNPKAEFYFNYPELINKIILEKDRKDFPQVKYLESEKI